MVYCQYYDKNKNAIPEQRNPLIEGPDLASWEEELLSGANSQEAKEAFKHRPAHEQLGVMTVQLDVAVKDERREAFARGNKAQDHGTAATRKGHDPKYYDYSYDLRGFDSLNKQQLREALIEAQDEYLNSLTPAQLEQEANKILGEDVIDITEDSYEELPAEFIINSEEAVIDGEPAPEADGDDEQDVEDSMIVQGGEQLREQLKSLKPVDQYETRAKDDDAEDYVLDGMHIVTAPKSSYRM